MRAICIIGVLALMGCETVPMAAGPDSGASETFKLTATSTFGVQTVTSGEINARADEVCPKGYSTLHRGPQITRRSGGVFYTDVTVRVTCAG